MSRYNKKQKHDDGVYYSNSTIDSSEKNFSLPEFDEKMKDVEDAPHQRNFRVEMHLSLTPLGQKAVKIPVCVGEYASTRVMETLEAMLVSRRVKNVIEAVLDNLPPEPKTKPVSETLKDLEEKNKDREVIVVVQSEQQPKKKKKKTKKGQLRIGNDGAGHFSDPNSEDYFGDEVPDETIQESDVPKDNSDPDFDEVGDEQIPL